MAAAREFLSTIRIRLILIVILAVLPMLVVTLYAGYEQREQAIGRAQESALSVARLAASDQGRLMEGTRQLLVAMSHFPAVRDYDSEACGRFVADLLAQNPLYSNLGAATPDGNVFCAAVSSPTPTNCGDRSFFQQCLRTKDFVIGNYITMRITGKPGIAAVYPVLDDAGQVRAVVFAGIDLTWLDGFVAQAQLPEGSTLSVIDHAGTILTRYPDPDQWRGQSLPEEQAQLLLAQSEGLSEAAGLDGVQRLYAFARISAPPEGELYVRVGIPRAIVLAEAERILRRNLIALLAATLLAFTLAGLEGNLFVLWPLNAMVRAVRRFDAGDFTARVGRVPRSRELDNLARAFDRMAATVEAREAERDASEEKLRQETARAEALAAAATRLNAQLDLQGVLDTVCQEATRALSIESACVGLYDESEDTLRMAAPCGLPDGVCGPIQDSCQTLLARLIEDGDKVSLIDVVVRKGQECVAGLAECGVHTLLGVPMLREGQLIGVIVLFTAGEAAQFSEEDIRFLRAISDLAAQVVDNATLYESLQREERRRAELLRSVMSAQEDERKRLARELHDETSQGLTALMIGLESADMALASSREEASAHLQSTKCIAKKMLTDIRRLVGDLRPSLLDDLGLLPAIAWYGKQRLAPLGIDLELKCDSMETRLPPEYETALFRIVQEALTNIVKHSQADRVSVDLQTRDGQLMLRVADNGRGFAPSPDGNGFGLEGIQERVTILGGEFSVQAAPGQGTVLEARLPLVD
jgi:signal transduction histidine kinase/HAMP domain-containing protein